MGNFDFQQTGPVLQEIINSVGGKAEQTEVNELRALYEALTQSNIVPVPSADWPVSNPQVNVIYRVAGTSSYTDYMWDGTDFIPMATYDNVPTDIPTVGSTDVITAGGVANHGSAFDISEYNKNGATLATYANLSAALAAVPSSVQKGGMSIKFVRSSDNKYVQYRYMSSSTAAADFTNVANWQGVDDVPTAGSENLVKSNGVYENIFQYTQVKKSSYSSYIKNFNLTNRQSKWVSNSTYKCAIIPKEMFGDYILFKSSTFRVEFAPLKSDNAAANVAPDYSDEVTTYMTVGVGTSLVYKIPSDCNYIYVYIGNNADSGFSINNFTQSGAGKDILFEDYKIDELAKTPLYYCQNNILSIPSIKNNIVGNGILEIIDNLPKIVADSGSTYNGVTQYISVEHVDKISLSNARTLANRNVAVIAAYDSEYNYIASNSVIVNKTSSDDSYSCMWTKASGTAYIRLTIKIYGNTNTNRSVVRVNDYDKIVTQDYLQSYVDSVMQPNLFKNATLSHIVKELYISNRDRDAEYGVKYLNYYNNRISTLHVYKKKNGVSSNIGLTSYENISNGLNLITCPEYSILIDTSLFVSAITSENKADDSVLDIMERNGVIYNSVLNFAASTSFDSMNGSFTYQTPFTVNNARIFASWYNNKFNISNARLSAVPFKVTAGDKISVTTGEGIVAYIMLLDSEYNTTQYVDYASSPNVVANMDSMCIITAKKTTDDDFSQSEVIGAFSIEYSKCLNVNYDSIWKAGSNVACVKGVYIYKENYDPTKKYYLSWLNYDTLNHTITTIFIKKSNLDGTDEVLVAGDNNSRFTVEGETIIDIYGAFVHLDMSKYSATVNTNKNLEPNSIFNISFDKEIKAYVDYRNEVLKKRTQEAAYDTYQRILEDFPNEEPFVATIDSDVHSVENMYNIYYYRGFSWYYCLVSSILAKSFQMDATINLGDLGIDAVANDGEAFNLVGKLKSAYQESSDIPLALAIGNHESKVKTSNRYKSLVKNLIDSRTSVFSSTTDRLRENYCIDLTDKQVRIICLNLYENGESADRDLSYAEDYLTTALLETPDNYSVVLCVHEPFYNVNGPDWDVEREEFANMRSILGNYTSKEGAFANVNSRLAIILAGHTHCTGYCTVNGINEYNTAGIGRCDTSVLNSSINESLSLGNDVYANIVVVSPNQNKVKIYRVGKRGENADVEFEY